jgi:hypothetical protein
MAEWRSLDGPPLFEKVRRLAAQQLGVDRQILNRHGNGPALADEFCRRRNAQGRCQLGGRNLLGKPQSLDPGAEPRQQLLGFWPALAMSLTARPGSPGPLPLGSRHANTAVYWNSQ